MSLGLGGLAGASRPRPQAMAVVRNAAGTKRKEVFMLELMKNQTSRQMDGKGHRGEDEDEEGLKWNRGEEKKETKQSASA